MPPACRAVVGALIAALAGCQAVMPSGPERATVSGNLAARAGAGLRPAAGSFEVPPGVVLEDGLSEEEAVATALWNNAAFQELLADLGIARGDLIQAGLLPNPEMAYFVQMSHKPFKYLFDFPVEALWLRPIRVAAAQGEACRTAERLTQAGLDLIRDVRQAHSDVALAQARVRIAKESAELRGKIAEFAEKRLKAGDISAQEAATARIDGLQAKQDVARVEFDVGIAGERLRNLLGAGCVPNALEVPEPPNSTELPIEPRMLADEAMKSRPDATAAAEATAAAAERLRLAKLGWFRALGILDATSGTSGHQFGPALRFTLPVFNRNEGAIARAEAEWQKAKLGQQTIAQQIVLDVQRAGRQHAQARSELDILRATVRPEVEAQIARAQKSFEKGNVPVLIVLEATRALLDNRQREALLEGDLRRFRAELERSVGRRVFGAAAVPNAVPAQAQPLPPAKPAPTPVLPPAKATPKPAALDKTNSARLVLAGPALAE